MRGIAVGHGRRLLARWTGTAQNAKRFSTSYFLTGLRLDGEPHRRGLSTLHGYQHMPAPLCDGRMPGPSRPWHQATARPAVGHLRRALGPAISGSTGHNRVA